MKLIILFLFVISTGVCFADECHDSFKIDTSTIFSKISISSKDIPNHIPSHIESLRQIYEGSQYSLEEKVLAIKSLQIIGKKHIVFSEKVFKILLNNLQNTHEIEIQRALIVAAGEIAFSRSEKPIDNVLIDHLIAFLRDEKNDKFIKVHTVTYNLRVLAQRNPNKMIFISENLLKSLFLSPDHKMLEVHKLLNDEIIDSVLRIALKSPRNVRPEILQLLEDPKYFLLEAEIAIQSLYRIGKNDMKFSEKMFKFLLNNLQNKTHKDTEVLIRAVGDFALSLSSKFFDKVLTDHLTAFSRGEKNDKFIKEDFIVDYYLTELARRNPDKAVLISENPY